MSVSLKYIKQQIANQQKLLLEIADNLPNPITLYEDRIQSLTAENERLRGVVEEIARRGIFADTTPTVNLAASTEDTIIFFYGFLKDIDKHMRARAKAAIEELDNA